MAEFESPGRLLDAARRLRSQGWNRLEAFTPFPVEGLDRLLGYTDNAVARAMMIGGTVGALAAFLMQAGINLAYPLWIGGRPLIAVPAFMLICFEMLVLGAVLSGIATMFIANRLPRLNHPVFAADRFDLSAERFFLAILPDAGFDRDAAGKALAALTPRAIIEVQL
ncbi:DUF3341 domain-containing protein [Novosphingobium sp. PhB165]|uniref:DUF3341 domain-containing protein n=1 Tax=Novosphingobium sp. PhB165 TaxID=2485105 RepID=UPI001404FBA6|nr:DUF3341 domain-containing protein [Novosphingobium sp. PhB165]